MKIEIKEIEKERQNGYYKVKYHSTKTVAQYCNQMWYVISVPNYIDPNSIKVLDENPIVFEETECKPEFEPIELELIIESKEELQELFHRFNLSFDAFINDEINGYSFCNYTFRNENRSPWDIHNKIKKIMETRNIEP